LSSPITDWLQSVLRRMDRGLGVGFRVPRDPTLTAPTAGSVRLNIVSRETDIVEAKKELVLACILGGIGGFRGLPNPVFKRHLRNLRLLVNLDPMAPASEWNAAARKCWPRVGRPKDLWCENARERDAGLVVCAHIYDFSNQRGIFSRTLETNVRPYRARSRKVGHGA
jgi:hypothetical protein